MSLPCVLTGPVGEILGQKRVVVCCGAGGVGKTTTSAALALLAARAGRRVLVLTIDPSRRLAETLGVSQNPAAPVPLSAERLAAAGIVAPGSLDAWLLAPKQVADVAVRRLTRDPQEAERFLGNRIYQQVSLMVAGMHEYTAMEALHRLLAEGHYDLVVLDTPPSRNALDFLDAPGRLSRLLDGKVFRALLPRQGGLFSRAASRVVHRVLSAAFGVEFAEELVGFMSAFSGLFGVFTADVSAMRAFLGGPHSAFLMVCAPTDASVVEAHFFQDRALELGLPFRGFVLNRCRGVGPEKLFPSDTLLPPEASPAAVSGFAKLRVLAREELGAAECDRRLLEQLSQRAGHGRFAVAVPGMPQGADDMGTLIAVARALAAA